MRDATGSPRAISIWWFAFGYFACYAPYSALAKALSDGRIPGMRRGVPSFELLPVSTLSSLVGMFVFLTTVGWWKYAGRARVGKWTIPFPSRWTFLSGVCTSAILLTTTLAYTFHGVSIVFVMLLMRGGVLVLAPVVDLVSGRRTRWFSWAALLLSLSALLVPFFGRAAFALTVACGVDVAIYLVSYFIRLRFMSRLAKGDDPNANVRFFVEEQMVATPVAVLALAAMALVGRGTTAAQLQSGFTSFWSSPVLAYVIVMGILSQGTGVFGGLILLDKRENTFCVPVNRCSSVLAGVLASYGLTWFFHVRAPSHQELFGAALIISAIGFLSIPPLLERRRARGSRQ